MMNAEFAGWLADAMLALHVGVVLFVVGLLPLVIVGGMRGWAWVRRFGLRLTHVLLMVFIAGQAWLGQLCPLTVWEQDLRRIAGEVGYRESFIEHWLSRLLYWEAPWWVFVAVYTGFAVLVVGETERETSDLMPGGGLTAALQTAQIQICEERLQSVSGTACLLLKPSPECREGRLRTGVC
jgi:Na+(H+)/acetate symporter ActP